MAAAARCAVAARLCLIGRRRHRRNRSRDRFKSLFGGKSDEEPADELRRRRRPQDTGDLTCPPVTIRAGASTYAVAAPGKQPVGNDLRFQATITKMARECTVNGGEITARIGIQGRVIAGPAGAPSSVEVPLRVAVVQGGVSEKTIATKAYQTTVNDDRRRQRAVHAGGRGSRLSGAARRRRRQLHLLYRLRSAGPEARAKPEAPKKKKRSSIKKKPARSISRRL